MDRSSTPASRAQELLQSSIVIDLHIDSFIWNRFFRYDIAAKHDPHFLNGWFMHQVDLPRLHSAGVNGAMWSITTNPFRTGASRARTFEKNISRMEAIIQTNSDKMQLVSNSRDLHTILDHKKHAAWIVIQGGNALDHDLELIDRHQEKLTRVTLMHLTHSKLGTSSAPCPRFQKRGLTKLGHEFVKRLNQNRIFVDLAHADRETFMDAVVVHDKSQPLIVTHTGLSGVYPHWRNIDDEQMKNIADTGGVIGVMYQASFLGKGAEGKKTEAVVRHLEHIRKVVGEDFTALGSDWDGMVIPPLGLRSCDELANLVDVLLQRKWTTTEIEKALGLNYLRAFQQLRP
jgi:membrane dipeptidase